MQGQNLLLLDLNKCTRCDECVKACVATHHDGVTRLVRDGLRFENFLVATSCRACMDPLCMTRCPVGSIRRKDSLDIVIEDWCIGCGNCATDCPYGNINVVEVMSGTQAEAGAAPQGRGLRPVRGVSRSRTACAPARTMPPSGWSRKTFFARDWPGMQLAVCPTPSPPPVSCRRPSAENMETQDLFQRRRTAGHAAAAEDRLRTAWRDRSCNCAIPPPPSDAPPATTTAFADDYADVARAGRDCMRGQPLHAARPEFHQRHAGQRQCR